jgi:DNA-binding MarR family transcriptional regulator
VQASTSDVAHDQTPATATPSAEATLGGDLFALVTYLHKSCTADLFEAVGAIELSLTQIKLLHHLDDCPRELTLKQAAEAVHISLPAASRMVDDLVQRGLVERKEDADDRRMKRIRITEDARRVIGRVNAARLIGIERFVDGLTQAERHALSRVLTTLLARPEIAASRPQGQEAP